MGTNTVASPDASNNAQSASETTTVLHCIVRTVRIFTLVAIPISIVGALVDYWSEIMRALAFGMWSNIGASLAATFVGSVCCCVVLKEIGERGAGRAERMHVLLSGLGILSGIMALGFMAAISHVESDINSWTRGLAIVATVISGLGVLMMNAGGMGDSLTNKGHAK